MTHKSSNRNKYNNSRCNNRICVSHRELITTLVIRRLLRMMRIQIIDLFVLGIKRDENVLGD